MKSTRRLGRAPERREAGTALIIVLSTLVLVSLLVVAFFSSVSRELTASQSYASGFSARAYGDAAVNIVIGQLRAATTKEDATATWVSQPGLIRRYDDQGKLQQAFKLYSSDRMVEGNTFAPLTSAGAPSDVPAWTAGDATDTLPWNHDPGVYVDLNSPIVVNARARYPILNPGGLNAATKIGEFDVAANYGLPDTKDVNGNGDTSEIGQIPMPVRWLYILANGKMATGTADGAKTVRLTLPDGSTPDASNPPVARVAFWTDDDTCRLNVNTASEGTFWTNHVAAATDDSLSSGQVNANEFQRYPGHPATTSLSPALGFLTTNDSDLRNFIYGLAPRVSGRGSQQGKRTVGFAMPVNRDDDRLYSSLDELLFLPTVNTADQKRFAMNSDNMVLLKPTELDWNYTGGTDKSMTGTKYSFSGAISLDPARLDLLNFFLTTHSRAPEVNLMGKPRVSLWPIDTRSDHQSIYDQLLAFCGTVGGQPYYFQRQNPDSQTEDYNGIGRNVDLLDYLKTLTDTAIPGTGGKFSTKYQAADRPQTLTEMFDWIRTVNLAYRDKAGAVKPYAWETNPAASGAASPPGKPGSGQVLPIKIGATQGFGRFPTLSKAAMSIIREEQSEDASDYTVKYRLALLMETYVPVMGYAAYVPNYQLKVSNLASSFDLAVNTSTKAAVTTFPATMKDGFIQVTSPANVEPYVGRAWGGTQGYNNLFTYLNSASGYTLSPRVVGSSDSVSGYPFVSDQIVVKIPKTDATATTNIRVGMNVKSPVTVQILDAAGAHMISSYTLNFENFAPVAGGLLADVDASDGIDGPAATTSERPILQDRVNEMVTAFKTLTGGELDWLSWKEVVAPVDVIRGLELTSTCTSQGDLRLLALHGTNADNVFGKQKNYADLAYPQAHSLLRAGGGAEYATDYKYTDQYPLPATPAYKTPSRGFLVAGTSTLFDWGTGRQFYPQVPSTITALTNLSPAPAGDFTTGLASEGDGPHIIKADEGNSSVGGSNWGMSVQYPYQNQLFPYDDHLSDIFSPNRQVTSAVQFGTLPAAAGTGQPWRTLLFRPDLNGTHPGAQNPPDYMLLDLFWMPVVDPYAISEPLSTAGKVNMNSQIVPFTYVKRETALAGALKSTRLLAFDAASAKFYKWSGYTVKGSFKPISFLYDVDLDKTLLFFDERFASSDKDNNIFKSPAEICSIPLAPKQTATSRTGTGHSDNIPPDAVATVNISSASDAATLRARIKDFWNANTLTGDNVREAPYNGLYPRLTTQSDSYTVYVRVQALQVSPASPPGHFSDVRDQVTGEYRGSYEVERYIDPSNADLPDFAKSPGQTVYSYYQFRVKNAKQFLP